MSNEEDIKDWFDHEYTRRQLDRLHTEITGATKAVLIAAENDKLDEIRSRLGYRRGLLKAWSLLTGKATRDAEEEA